MAAHVMCLTSSGGIPIFTRKKGEGSTITFPKMASLSGIHMFLKSQDIKLNNTKMRDTVIIWKEFADSITLIAIASGTTKKILEYFVDAVFNSMVLVLGIDEIKYSRNIERLKKELRPCNALIDKLLECLDIGDRVCSGIDLITMSGSILYPENYLLQTCLEMFLEHLNSTYGCILSHGSIAVATDSFWQLDSVERKLLILAMSQDRNCSACDIPVFLPKMSPNVAFRLVSVSLVNGIQVLAVCGPTPDLIEIEKIASQCWRNNLDILRAAEKFYPQFFPSEMSLDPSIIGLLLVKSGIGKFIVGKNSKHLKNHPVSNHKLDILRTFYYQAVETFLTVDNINTIQALKNKSEKLKKFHAKEIYWCSEYSKCHGIKERDNIICILYTFSIPTSTMRLITKRTLKMILSDKQICW